MFSVDRDSSARTGRYTINHSVRKTGLGWGDGWWGAGWRRGQWQFGKVMWAELLACGEATPSPSPPYHTISPTVATTLCLSVTFFSLTSYVSSPLFRDCVYPLVCISWAWLSVTLLSVRLHISCEDRIDWNLRCVCVWDKWYVSSAYMHKVLYIIYCTRYLTPLHVFI